MTDTELLDWLLAKLDQGVQSTPVYAWFLDGLRQDWEHLRRVPYPWDECEALKKAGRLELKTMGMRLEWGLSIESNEHSGPEGVDIKDALLRSANAEKPQPVKTPEKSGNT